MKHLLIILISILLLSSPVIGDNHKGETLYWWGFGECQVEPCDYKWMGFGDKNTQPKYQGQVKDGKPNGLGVMNYPNGWKYVGSFKDGKPLNGTGYDKDGNILGKIVNGEQQYPPTKSN